MRRWIPAILILGTVMFAAMVFQRLPETMAIHWGLSGKPDGYGSRAYGAFVLPVVALALWGLMVGLPKLDPRRSNVEQFRGAYEILIIAVVAVLCLLQVAVIGSALGWSIQMARLTPISIGALFLVLGVLLPRFRSNFFIGIRTPWTLSSETVWARTHQVGGYVMALVGGLMILAGIAGTARWAYVAIGGTGVMVTFVLVYSYVLWRSERRDGGRG